MLGGHSDAYPSVDATEQHARVVVEELVLSRRKYSVITKSTLVAREAALFAKSQCRVSMSLCSVDDDELARLDPGAEPHRARLEALRTVADAGVNVRVNVMPWIPGVSDLHAIVAEVRRILGPKPWVVVERAQRPCSDGCAYPVRTSLAPTVDQRRLPARVGTGRAAASQGDVARRATARRRACHAAGAPHRRWLAAQLQPLVLPQVGQAWQLPARIICTPHCMQ